MSLDIIISWRISKLKTRICLPCPVVIKKMFCVKLILKLCKIQGDKGYCQLFRCCLICGTFFVRRPSTTALVTTYKRIKKVTLEFFLKMNKTIHGTVRKKNCSFAFWNNRWLEKTLRLCLTFSLAFELCYLALFWTKWKSSKLKLTARVSSLG